MADDAGWCTIESDPGVFTALLAEIGVKNVQVEELYSLDREQLAQHDTVYGLVFLFKYRPDEKAKAAQRPGRLLLPPPESLFFAKQAIQNACATQAILSIVLNSPSLDIGTELSNFRDFTTGMDPLTTGMVVSNSEVIRKVHNSFAPQQQFVVEENPLAEKDDPFHFVAYIPHNGKVFELDGLQAGPREHGSFEEAGAWLDVVTPIITQRIEEYNGSEIRFNIMALVEDPRARLMAELERLRADSGDDGRIGAIESELAREKEKHDRWELENNRRRWNFVPFLVSFLKAVAEGGEVEGLIDRITEKKKTAYREALQKENAEKEGAGK